MGASCMRSITEDIVALCDMCGGQQCIGLCVWGADVDGVGERCVIDEGVSCDGVSGLDGVGRLGELGWFYLIDGIVRCIFWVICIGLQISQSPRGIFINQSKYALESLKKYGMKSSDPVDTPMVEKSKLDEDPQGKAVNPTHYRGMVGTLMYLTASRPDLTFVVCMCAQYQARLVSWSSKGQKSVAISSTEAEYIALSGCCAQVLWMRSQFTDYGLGFNKIPIFHFIKEQVENGVVELYFVNTKYQLADIFTKALCREIIKFLINKLRMRSFTPETLKLLADEAEE
ncbi:hypothetical protein Tco_0359744 [Tanacetum coccineum]